MIQEREMAKALDWLKGRKRTSNRADIFYHADVDGCVSAAFWNGVLATLGFESSSYKIRTAELGFERAEQQLFDSPADVTVFLDVPAGTRFGRWSQRLPPHRSVFVYDHHDVGQTIAENEPRLVQFAARVAGDLPPTAVFSHAVYRAATGDDARWLVTVGVLGEGQQDRFPELVSGWRFARPVVKLVAHGVLREDSAALDYLRHYLECRQEPPDPAADALAFPLRATSAEVEGLIQSAVAEVLRGGDSHFVVGLLTLSYPIANYVASEVRHRRRAAVVLVGESVDPDLVRAELRIGRELDLDLRPWMEEAKLSGLLLGGGGHRAAVGARLRRTKWEAFVEFCRRKTFQVN